MEIISPPPLSALAREYIASISGHKSLRTVNSYQSSLSKFINFAGDFSIDKISPKLINDGFKNYLVNEQHLNEISAAYIMQHVRYFLEYLLSKNFTLFDLDQLNDKKIIQSLKPNSRQYTKEIITEEEVERIINYWKNSTDSNNPRGIRNQVVIDLLWETGMSVSELEMLTIDDIDWQHGILKLQYKDPKKQYKNREIKLSPDAMVLLKRYFDVREDSCQALIVAFNSWNPYIVQAWPLTARSIQRLIRNTANDLKITKQISPSVFRATRYAQLINQGKTIPEINKALGISGTSRQYLKYKTQAGVPEHLMPLSEIGSQIGLNTAQMRLYLKSHNVRIVNFRQVLYVDRRNLERLRINQNKENDI